MTTPEGNMNPKFTEVDIEPDEDLNTKLKFFVSSQLTLMFRALMAILLLKNLSLLNFSTFFIGSNLRIPS